MTMIGNKGLALLLLVQVWSIGAFAADDDKPNVLFVTTDQQRYDALRFVQEKLPKYRNEFKISTPNLDKLAQGGVYFRYAYCQVPSCAPARTTLFTGCTSERTGVQKNDLVEEGVYSLMKHFERKIEAYESIEEILAEKEGYIAAQLGKFHMPDIHKQVFTYNNYDFEKDRVNLIGGGDNAGYQLALAYLTKRDGIEKHFDSGDSKDPRSGFPMKYIALSSRGFTKVKGWGELSTNYSASAISSMQAVEVLKQLKIDGKPFILKLNFVSPHGPMVGSPEYKVYGKQEKRLFVSPTNLGPFDNTAYPKDPKLIFSKANVTEFTAVYYALINEVDTWFGQVLEELDRLELASNTLIIFTSDHGEQLGAHGLEAKNTLYEESARIPLIMSFPGHIVPGTVVDLPVSHLDVVATILDYLNMSKHDNGDGQSLRRHIEKKSFNEYYDDQYAVVETDYRYPVSRSDLSEELANLPNFMIRWRNFKLIISKDNNSKLLDMMFDLQRDPYEKMNLVGKNGMTASDATVGRAEHLKCLLLEWMRRNDGTHKYYSNPKYNAGEGKGDISEITARRTWKLMKFWQSDRTLVMGKPVQRDGLYLRNEYLYIGRTLPGRTKLVSIAVNGTNDARNFLKVSYPSTTSIANAQCLRIKVAFSAGSRIDINSLKAKIVIKTKDKGESVKKHVIPIRG